MVSKMEAREGADFYFLPLFPQSLYDSQVDGDLLRSPLVGRTCLRVRYRTSTYAEEGEKSRDSKRVH